MNEELVDTLERSHSHLIKLPRVLNTRIGTKIKDGADTGIPCITVIVSEKIEESLLALEEIIPKFIECFPTDVIELKPDTWVAGKTKTSELTPEIQRRIASGVRKK
jgi:hypothetical protein